MKVGAAECVVEGRARAADSLNVDRFSVVEVSVDAELRSRDASVLGVRPCAERSSSGR